MSETKQEGLVESPRCKCGKPTWSIKKDECDKCTIYRLTKENTDVSEEKELWRKLAGERGAENEQLKAEVGCLLAASVGHAFGFDGCPPLLDQLRDARKWCIETLDAKLEAEAERDMLREALKKAKEKAGEGRREAARKGHHCGCTAACQSIATTISEALNK